MDHRQARIIQRAWKRYYDRALKFDVRHQERVMCVNDESFLGSSLDSSEVAFYWVEERGVRYGFDLLELAKLDNKDKNPYTMRRFTPVEKASIRRCSRQVKFTDSTDTLSKREQISSIIGYVHNMFQKANIGFDPGVLEDASSDQLLKIIFMLTQNNEVTLLNGSFFELTKEILDMSFRNSPTWTPEYAKEHIFWKLAVILRSCILKNFQMPQMLMMKCYLIREIIMQILTTDSHG